MASALDWLRLVSVIAGKSLINCAILYSRQNEYNMYSSHKDRQTLPWIRTTIRCAAMRHTLIPYDLTQEVEIKMRKALAKTYHATSSASNSKSVLLKRLALGKYDERLEFAIAG